MDSDFIPTRGSRNNVSAAKTFISVIHKNHKAKAKPILATHDEELDEDPVDVPVQQIIKHKEYPEINLKRAKQEILKFGITGFDTATQEDAKVKLAIKLGAKPPKNKHKNYKVILEEKKHQKKAKENQAKLQQLGKNQAGKSTAKGKSFDKKRKAKNDLLNVYGTVKKSIKDVKSKSKVKKK